MHKYISLDTEATGVDFCSSQVIQCGAVFLDERLQPTGRKEWNINYMPEKFSWSEQASEVHGISREEAVSHGVDPERFLKEFEQEIVKHYGIRDEAELHIVATNAHFDYLMLLLLWNTYISDYELPLSRRLLDLTALSLAVLGDAGTTTMVEKLSIQVDDDKQHSALYDAELHLRILHGLLTVARQEGVVLPYE